MKSLRVARITIMVVVAALVGCAGKGDDAAVSGSVLLDGQPLAGADVQFIPKGDASLGMHSAATDSAGKFALVGDSNVPVKPGAYIVLVSKLAVKEGSANQAAGGKGTMVNIVPFDYQNRGKTPLKADIKPGVNKLPPFELKSAARKG